MSGAELDSYLQDLQQEGQLQSHGDFTLDFEKALQKLAGMAGQHVHRWLFYGVQAAVAYGAERIQVSDKDFRFSLAFHFREAPASLLNGHSFQSVEEKPDLRGEAAADQCLRQALLWGRAQQPKEFQMEVCGPRSGYRLSSHQKGMVYTPLEATDPHTPTTCRLAMTGRDAEFWGAHWAALLKAEAIYRLSFCPVPAYLNEQELSLGESSALMRNRRRREGNFKLWERYLLNPSAQGEAALAVQHPLLQPALRYRIEGRPEVTRSRSALPIPRCACLEFAGPQVLSAHWREVEASQSFGLTVAEWTQDDETRRLCLEVDPGIELPAFQGQRVKVRALFTRMRVEGNYLILARHGLLLDPIPIGNLPSEGWVAVVASNLIHTDASGLVAVQDERVEQLIRWVQAEILAIHLDQAQGAAERGSSTAKGRRTSQT